MTIDLVALGLFLLGGWLGYRSGFFRQLARIVALVAGFLVARLIAQPVGDLISRGLDVTPFLANTVSFIAIMFLVSLAVSLMAGAMMGGASPPGVALTFVNRGFGGLLGAAKAGALVYILLSAFAIVQPMGAMGSLADSPHMDLSRSIVGRHVLKNNLLDREVIPRAKALANVAEILQNPRKLRAAMEHPDFELILDHPRGQFLREPTIQAAILGGHWDVLWQDGRIFALFGDMELVRALNRLRFDEDGNLLPADPLEETKPAYLHREP